MHLGEHWQQALKKYSAVSRLQCFLLKKTFTVNITQAGTVSFSLYRFSLIKQQRNETFVVNSSSGDTCSLVVAFFLTERMLRMEEKESWEVTGAS